MDALSALDPKTSAFKILTYLTFKDTVLKPAEIAKGTGINGSTVRARLTELRKNGLVESTGNGYVAKIRVYDILMKLYLKSSI